MPDGERRVYRKLVRDRIPEIIEADGHVAVQWALDDQGFLDAALSKVTEEVEELRQAAPEDRCGELADIWEVLQAVTDAVGLTFDEVQAEASRKRAERGGFAKRIWLEEVRAEGQ